MSKTRLHIFLLFCLTLVGCADQDARQSSGEPIGSDTPSRLSSNDATVDNGLVDPRHDTAALARLSDQLDRTVWANELLAQEHEAPFVQLGDELRSAADKFGVLKRFRFQRLLVGEAAGSTTFDWAVVETRYRRPDSGQPRQLDHKNFVQWLERFERLGFALVQSEWHHTEFHPPDGTNPPSSVISMELNLSHPKKNHTLVLSGDIKIQWSEKRDERGKPLVHTIDATNLKLVEREAPPVFSAELKVQPRPEDPRASQDVMPLLVHDLNHDGLPEIILGGANAVIWNQGDFRFERTNLIDDKFSLWHSGVVADFTGDGIADLVGVDGAGHGVLCAGAVGGKFAKPRVCWAPVTEFPSAITAGDVDRDGDLDVWLTQYKPPYIKGQMPTPYYDANDGYPSYFLLNDGQGNFHDDTQAAGLAARRNRRTYSASFVDLDQDEDLDLVVVSDFSGLDIYENDGSGRFQECTDELVDERHAFGMSHTFGDFDSDGALDLYMVGMSSTTARRLDSLGLGRAEFAHYDKMRAPMTYGNRLYQARDGRYIQTPLGDAIARAGWAWGCSAFDFDNDGDDDLYVANGHISGKSSRDYCTRYWCHDVYTGTSREDPAVARLLTDDFRPTDLRGLNDGLISWNGYEHNRLYMNLDGKDFLGVGFPMGVAYEFDSRCVVTPDLDADGRPDLLLVKQDWAEGRGGIIAQQTLLALKNQLETDNHWIGVHLRTTRPGTSPIGAKVTIEGPWGRRQRVVVTGDSYYCQSPSTVHFGLGQHTQVDRIVVQWPDRQVVVDRPGIGQYHVVTDDGGEEGARGS